MKPFSILLMLLLSLAFSSCNKPETYITVEVSGQPELTALIYTVPISGTTYSGFIDTLRRNETGAFELKMKISQPSFVTIWDKDHSNRVKLLVEQGNSYHVSMDSEKNVQITGINEKGQMLYTTFPDPSYIEMELRNWLRDTTMTLTSVQHQISELKQSDLLQFKELLDNKEITKSYFNLIQKDRDCYYASLEARFSIIKSYRMEIEPGDSILVSLKRIYDQYPPDDERLLFSSFWPEYAERFVLEYKQFIQGDVNIQKFRELRNNGTFNTYMINESKKYLDGKALEFFQAKYIYNECFQGSHKGSFDKEFIPLFEQFENDYPQSEYSKYIKPYIEKIITYHQIIENPYDPSIVFLDNYETFNTLEEVIKPLQGKKIYIDVWATWCGPCKVEFAHNEALKKILAENDIQLLYISIDRDDYDQQWKNEIKYQHLTDMHIRVNKALYDDLMKRFDKNAKEPYIAIPWYILVDEKGNIIEEHAKSPSQLVAGEKLF